MSGPQTPPADPKAALLRQANELSDSVVVLQRRYEQARDEHAAARNTFSGKLDNSRQPGEAERVQRLEAARDEAQRQLRAARAEMAEVERRLNAPTPSATPVADLNPRARARRRPAVAGPTPAELAAQARQRRIDAVRGHAKALAGVIQVLVNDGSDRALRHRLNTRPDQSPQLDGLRELAQSGADRATLRAAITRAEADLGLERVGIAGGFDPQAHDASDKPAPPAGTPVISTWPGYWHTEPDGTRLLLEREEVMRADPGEPSISPLDRTARRRPRAVAAGDTAEWVDGQTGDLVTGEVISANTQSARVRWPGGRVERVSFKDKAVRFGGPSAIDQAVAQRAAPVSAADLTPLDRIALAELSGRGAVPLSRLRHVYGEQTQAEQDTAIARLRAAGLIAVDGRTVTLTGKGGWLDASNRAPAPDVDSALTRLDRPRRPRADTAGPSTFRQPRSVADRITQVTQTLAREPGALVYLSDLREQLGDISREDLDRDLRRLAGAGLITLTPQEDPRQLNRDPRRKDAAIQFGGQPNHWISIEPPVQAPRSRPRLRGLERRVFASLIRQSGDRTGTTTTTVDRLLAGMPDTDPAEIRRILDQLVERGQIRIDGDQVELTAAGRTRWDAPRRTRLGVPQPNMDEIRLPARQRFADPVFDRFTQIEEAAGGGGWVLAAARTAARNARDRFMSGDNPAAIASDLRLAADQLERQAQQAGIPEDEMDGPVRPAATRTAAAVQEAAILRRMAEQIGLPARQRFNGGSR